MKILPGPSILLKSPPMLPEPFFLGCFWGADVPDIFCGGDLEIEGDPFQGLAGFFVWCPLNRAP